MRIFLLASAATICVATVELHQCSNSNTVETMKCPELGLAVDETNSGISFIQKHAEVVRKLSPKIATPTAGVEKTVIEALNKVEHQVSNAVLSQIEHRTTKPFFELIFGSLAVAVVLSVAVWFGLSYISSAVKADNVCNEEQVWEEPLKEGDVFSPNWVMINTCKMLVGVSFIGLPYAMAEGGMLAGIPLAIIVMLNGYTGACIATLLDVTKPTAKKLEVPKSAHDVPFLGQMAFGDIGGNFCRAMFIGELWFAQIFLLVMNAVNLKSLFPNSCFSRLEIGVIVVGLVSWATTFIDPKLFVWSSAIGVIFVFFALVTLLWSAALMNTWEIEVAPVQYFKVENLAFILGTFQSCCGCFHQLVPGWYHNMRNPKEDYIPAQNRGFIYGLIFFVALGLMSYGIYGMRAQASLLENLGRELSLKAIPNANFLYIGCTTCYLVSSQTSLPLVFAPVRDFSEYKWGIEKSSWIVRFVHATAIMMASTLIAVVLRDCLPYVQSLYGTLFATTNCVVMPAIYGLALLKARPTTKMLLVGTLIYGVYVLICGSYVNILQIIQTVGK